MGVLAVRRRRLLAPAAATAFTAPALAQQYVIQAPGGAVLVPAGSGGGTPTGDQTKENLLAFGADPTGVTSSGPAITAWLAAVDASGKVGYAPKGRYLMPAAVARLFNGHRRIEGDGAGLTVFVCEPGARFTFDVAKNPRTLDANGDAMFEQYRLMLGGFTMATRGIAADDAITVNYDFSQTMTDRGLIMQNVQFVGDDPNAHSWKRGLVGNRLWNPLIDDVHFKGKHQDAAPFDSQRAIFLHEPQAPQITRFNAYHAEAALEIGGERYCEGVNISRFEWVGVRYGALLSGTPVKAAGTTIDHGHVNAYERCILGDRLRMLNISDILCLKAPWSGYWQGIGVTNSEGIAIHHCRFRGNPGSPGGNDCVALGATHRSAVNNCDGGDFATVGSICILHAASNFNDVFDNVRGTNCAPVALFDGQLANRTRNT